MSNRHITVDELATSLRKIKAILDGLQGRVIALEVASGGEVTSNPFAVTYGSLEETVSDGIWDEGNARLGF